MINTKYSPRIPRSGSSVVGSGRQNDRVLTSGGSSRNEFLPEPPIPGIGNVKVEKTEGRAWG